MCTLFPSVISSRSSLLPLLSLLALLATVLGGGYLAVRYDRQMAAATLAELEAEAAAEKQQQEHGLSASDAEGNSSLSSPKTAKTSQARSGETVEEILRRRFHRSVEDLLPQGISLIEGRGGKGLSSQVKAHGVWFPVFDLSKAQPQAETGSTDTAASEESLAEQVELAQVPLSILSAPPPRATVGTPWQHLLAAVGGQPPYQWSVAPLPERGFSFDAEHAVLHATGEQEHTSQITVTVVDQQGESRSTSYTLVVLPAEPLRITTTQLPPAAVGVSYQAQIRATGGVPPYSWALLHTVEGLQLDSATGWLSGSHATAGELQLSLQLTDAQGSSAESQLALSISSGVEITTDSHLLPAAPRSPVAEELQATGGQPPYTWALLQGQLPPGIQLISTTGQLRGTTTEAEGLYQFTIQVKDSQRTYYQKTFHWAVHQGLIAQASQGCVGLAWRRQALAQALQAPVQAIRITRDGATVYEGAADNFVDSPVPLGPHLYIALAPTTAGQLQPCATARVTVLPTTLGKGQPGLTADPYADRVRSFTPLAPGGYGATSLPSNVLGPPHGRSTMEPAYRPTELLSLHAAPGAGGSIVMEFTDNIVRLAQGPDITLFENVMFVGGDPRQRFMEPATVEVALWEGEWLALPTGVNPPPSGSHPNLRDPGYYALGFAGINATTGDNPTDPSRSGGDSFDLNLTGSPLSWVRYLRITSTGHQRLRDSAGQLIQHTAENSALSGSGSSGFDLDAVSAVHW